MFWKQTITSVKVKIKAVSTRVETGERKTKDKLKKENEKTVRKRREK